jgi:hypothetical protein
MRYSLALIAVLVLALIVRIDVAFERDGWPSLAEEAEWERAALVYESVGLLASYDVAARPPLYPLFVSANYSVFGGRPLVGRVIQACLGCLTCWVAFQLGRKTLGRRTGLVAAGLCAVHPAFVFYAGILISDTLFIFLIALTMTAALGFSERPTHSRGFLLGATLGLASLCSQVALLWVPLLVGALLLTGGREAVGPVSKVLCAMMLVILPWTIRNQIVSGRFVPIAQRVGFDLLVGHEPGANGRYRDELRYLGMYGELSNDVENVVDRDRRVAEVVAGWMVDDPFRSLTLGGRKLLHLWSPFTYREGRGLNLFSLAVIAPVLVLGLWGAIHHRHQPIGWLALSLAITISLVHTITYAEGRFRLPVDFALLVPAADRGIVVASGVWTKVQARWRELADGGDAG